MFVHSTNKLAETRTKFHIIHAKLIMSVWCFTVHFTGSMVTAESNIKRMIYSVSTPAYFQIDLNLIICQRWFDLKQHNNFSKFLKIFPRKTIKAIRKGTHTYLILLLNKLYFIIIQTQVFPWIEVKKLKSFNPIL